VLVDVLNNVGPFYRGPATRCPRAHETQGARRRATNRSKRTGRGKGKGETTKPNKMGEGGGA
jgi:hypothetical protein